MEREASGERWNARLQPSGLFALVGEGTTTLMFTPETPPGNIRLVAVRFDFAAAPTPEPSSLWLFAVSTATLATAGKTALA